VEPTGYSRIHKPEVRAISNRVVSSSTICSLFNNSPASMLQLARDFLDFKDIETVLYRLRKESPDLPKMMVKKMKK